MPVKRSGKNVVEVRTGKVVQHCSSEKNAAAAVRIRNQAWHEKHGGSSSSRKHSRGRNRGGRK
jgi:hypothetical protein